MKISINYKIKNGPWGGGNLFVTNLDDDYKTYLDKNEEKHNKEFQKEHEFQTNVRGIKVRGSYPTQEEAELRCKMLREIDPNHDVFVGPIGTWMPFDPEAYKTGSSTLSFIARAMHESP